MENKKVTITYNGSTILPETELSNSNVIYNGNTIISDGEYTKTLNCANKVMNGNITVGTKTLNCNGKFMASDVTIKSENAAIIAGDKPTSLNPSSAYSGSIITNGYTCPTGISLTGSDRGTNVGTYSASYTPQQNYIWSDGTTDTVTVTLSITQKSISVFTITNEISCGTTTTTTITVKTDSGVPYKLTINNSNAKFNNASGASSITGTGTGSNQTYTIYGNAIGSTTITLSTNSSNYQSKTATCSGYIYPSQVTLNLYVKMFDETMLVDTVTYSGAKTWRNFYNLHKQYFEYEGEVIYQIPLGISKEQGIPGYVIYTNVSPNTLGIYVIDDISMWSGAEQIYADSSFQTTIPIDSLMTQSSYNLYEDSNY